MPGPRAGSDCANEDHDLRQVTLLLASAPIHRGSFHLPRGVDQSKAGKGLDAYSARTDGHLLCSVCSAGHCHVAHAPGVIVCYRICEDDQVVHMF